MTEHKHAEILRAIADGREVQMKHRDGTWHTPESADVNPIYYYLEEWRVKPEPRTPRRIWVNEYETWYSDIYMCKEVADELSKSVQEPRIACVEFIEVLPDE